MNTLLLRLLEPFFPLYQNFAARVAWRTLEGAERLADCYEGFLKKKHRLIFAFQHPSTAEPAIWPVVLATEVRKILRGRGLHAFPFAHLVYDSRIPLWAGSYLGWLLPQAGGVAIQRGKPDTQALRRLRRLALESSYPIMIAPEGGKTYRSSRWAELEDGTGTLALWCREDLAKSNRAEDVVILPLRVRFEYPMQAKSAWELTVSTLEKKLGLNAVESPEKRLLSIVSKMLSEVGLVQDPNLPWYELRKSAAEHLLHSLGGDPSKGFIVEVRRIEAVVLENTKRLSTQQRMQGNKLVAAEILYYFDYPWLEQEGSWAERHEALEAATLLFQLLLPDWRTRLYAPSGRYAVFSAGCPIALSRLPTGKTRQEELGWVRTMIQQDGHSES